MAVAPPRSPSQQMAMKPVSGSGLYTKAPTSAEEAAPYATMTEAAAREAAKEHREARQKSAERRRPPSPSRGRPRPREDGSDPELGELVVGCCPRGVPFCCLLCPASRVMQFWKSVGDVIFTGSFLRAAAYTLFLLSWGAFLIMAMLTHSYYDEHVRPLDTPPPDPSHSPVPTPWSPMPRGSRTAEAHFPVHFAHIASGILASLGLLLMTGYSMEDIPQSHPLYVAWSCSKQLFVVGALVCCGIGVLLGMAMPLQLIFNVDLYGRGYLIIPDLGAMFNAFAISASMGLCFWSKYMYYVEANTRRPDDPDDED